MYLRIERMYRDNSSVCIAIVETILHVIVVNGFEINAKYFEYLTQYLFYIHLFIHTEQYLNKVIILLGTMAHSLLLQFIVDHFEVRI